MTLNVGSKYILRFNIKGAELVYHAIIKEDDGILITFVDKFDKELTYNRSVLITAEEINGGGQ